MCPEIATWPRWLLWSQRMLALVTTGVVWATGKPFWVAACLGVFSIMLVGFIATVVFAIRRYREGS